MAVDEEGRDRARRRVNDELVRLPMSPTDLARRAGVDSDTVADFLNGKRWPQAAKRNAIATALGWKPEGIDLITRGEEPGPAETVSDQSEDAGVLLSMPPDALEGLSPAEREEVVTAAKLSALEKAREIRRRLDG